MSLSRRFLPALECMPTRIAPSTVAGTDPSSVAPPPTTYTVASIGDPTTTSSGEGSYPVILAPPPTTPPAPVC